MRLRASSKLSNGCLLRSRTQFCAAAKLKPDTLADNTSALAVLMFTGVALGKTAM
jgi:hypothetical protein